MDKEEIKNKIDLNNIKEFTTEEGDKIDYLVDFEGNFILPLSVLEVKLIEKIKDLEEKINKLEVK